jgi:sulfoxide reductase heme-binding subunit YedZ
LRECSAAIFLRQFSATESFWSRVSPLITNEVDMLFRLSPYWLWLLLALPTLTMIAPFFDENIRALKGVLHGSGEFSARFMIISMMATPLMMLTKGHAIARWLKTNRRYFGVAAFGYAALHVLAYIWPESMDRILAEATDLDLLSGWIAFAIFIPLAATSMDYAVRKMGLWWKPLQRWTYAAAVLTLVHWLLVSRDAGGAIVHFAPLAALTLYRLWWTYLRVRPARAS